MRRVVFVSGICVLIFLSVCGGSGGQRPPRLSEVIRTVFVIAASALCKRC